MNHLTRNMLFLGLFLLLVTILRQSSADIVLKDDFDDKTDGTLLASPNNIPEIGTIWTGTNSDYVMVQSTVSQSGKALKLTDTYVDSAWKAGSAILADTSIANNPTWVTANTTAIVKVDFSRQDVYGTAALRLLTNGIGLTSTPMVYCTANGDWRVWNYDTSAYINTGYSVGINGWTTIEIVMKWGDEDGSGHVSGTYDVYLARSADNSLGPLARTLVASDITINDNVITETCNMKIEAASSSYFGLTQYTSNTYWDNFSLTIVPEPTVMFGLGIGLLGLLKRKRA